MRKKKCPHCGKDVETDDGDGRLIAGLVMIGAMIGYGTMVGLGLWEPFVQFLLDVLK